MISEETRAYYDLKKRNDVRESAKRIRRQFLRYKDAEIIYSLQHKNMTIPSTGRNTGRLSYPRRGIKCRG